MKVEKKEREKELSKSLKKWVWGQGDKKKLGVGGQLGRLTFSRLKWLFMTPRHLCLLKADDCYDFKREKIKKLQSYVTKERTENLKKI